jgi:hypothetical protein
MATTTQAAADSRVRIVSEPQVVLYAGDGPAGRAAAEALRTADIPFRLERRRGRHAVSAEFGGLKFAGLSGVQELVRMLKAMEAAFFNRLQQSMPQLFNDAQGPDQGQKENRRSRPSVNARV